MANGDTKSVDKPQWMELVKECVKPKTVAVIFDQTRTCTDSQLNNKDANPIPEKFSFANSSKENSNPDGKDKVNEGNGKWGDVMSAKEGSGGGRAGTSKQDGTVKPAKTHKKNPNADPFAMDNDWATNASSEQDDENDSDNSGRDNKAENKSALGSTGTGLFPSSSDTGGLFPSNSSNVASSKQEVGMPQKSDGNTLTFSAKGSGLFPVNTSSGFSMGKPADKKPSIFAMDSANNKRENDTHVQDLEKKNNGSSTPKKQCTQDAPITPLSAHKEKLSEQKVTMVNNTAVTAPVQEQTKTSSNPFLANSNKNLSSSEMSNLFGHTFGPNPGNTNASAEQKESNQNTTSNTAKTGLGQPASGGLNLSGMGGTNQPTGNSTLTSNMFSNNKNMIDQSERKVQSPLNN